MENIEFKANKNKRSIESLIEDSAIDSSFNYEAQELRRAFNETVISMNVKNMQQEKQIEKLKILLRQYDENKKKYEAKIKTLEQQLTIKTAQYNDLSLSHQETKKKLNYFQYKFQTINQNRNLLEPEQSSYEQQPERDKAKKKKMKNEIYSQFSKMITNKIGTFTEDMKKMTLSQQAELRIEAFLEELIYINPYSEFQIAEQIKQEKRDLAKGKILTDGLYENEQDSWKMYERSLEKLKQLNVKQKQRQPLPAYSRYEPQQRQRSISGTKRKRLFY